MTMNERGCYCGIWDKNPAFFEAQGVPRGYCGLCDWCGQPGHTRHFPGAVPSTGTWCDAHYRRLSMVHPLGFPGLLIYSGAVIAALAFWFLRAR
jgi:hypothetical protein